MGMKTKGIVILITTLLFCACTKQSELIGQPMSSSQPTVDSQQQEQTLATSSPTPVQTATTPLKSQSPMPSAQSPKPAVLSIIPLPSTFHSDEKRSLSTIDTVVIHSVYNPTAKDPFAIANIKEVFDDEEVSSHFVIARDGKIYQLVSEEYQAWHAGLSTMPAPDNREKVNLFSVGIELVGNQTSGFTQAQYTSLGKLLSQEAQKLPLKYLTGHSDIAPGRKTDPWKFDWSKIDSSEIGVKILHATK
jgi:N-acetyl-anhydromuramyl-L-alanine amidase AmpD